MRQWIDIAAILLESSDVLYHGTTERLWKSSGKNVNFNLYLTDDLNEAKKYAEDAVKSKRDRPIVVVFKMSDLRSLPVEFEPDWGWIDALENDLKNQGKTLDRLPTWQESLSRVRSLCVSGFTDAMKRIGKTEIVEAAMLGEASEHGLNLVADYVIKDDKTYRTFVGDGKRWSMREADGQVFPDYHFAEQKKDELQRQFPKRRFFTQMVGHPS